MYGRSDPQQQWTVHAEFTIKHDGLEEGHVLPQTRTERDENGVRMVYTWSGMGLGQQQNQGSDCQSVKTQSSSASTSAHEKNVRDPQLPYGFQRGNLVFTSTPPSKPLQKNFHLNLHDSRNPGANSNIPDSSGYGSELLSPTSGSLPYRPSAAPQPYNRRCRSTCSIVLSTDFNQKPDEKYENQSQCGRTQSLRCQTPTVKCERKDSFYGCGDPWCYHSNESSPRFPPLQECDEYGSNSNSNSRRPSRASTYTGRHSDRTRLTPPPPLSKIVASKLKDASVQTFEMIDKCTSPFMRTDFSLKDSDSSDAKAKGTRKKFAYNSKRKTEPIYQRLHSPSSLTPDSLESQQSGRRAARVPSKVPEPKADTSPESRAGDPNKKPRTVHIDVYCTGTEQESSSSCSDSENRTASSPQTVFETGKFKLTHKKVGGSELPHLRKSVSSDRMSSVKELKKKFEKDESDDDGTSTAYPSQLSSFSAIKDFASSLSSVPPSWSTVSLSSYAIPDDDSVANTSWKDTYSDLASLLESRSSIAQTDSLDFVPRKLLQQRGSIEEYPEIRKDLAETSSKASLQPSDSFEYANSEDRLRIKQLEQMLQKSKQWKSPQTERKHLLQQRKLKEYLNKRLDDKSLPNWQGKDSDSEGTDSEEKGWSFVKEDKGVIKGEIVRPANKDYSNQKQCEPKIIISKPKVYEDQGSLSDSSPTLKSPSGNVLKQRFSLDPNLGTPFAIVPGIFTEQREVAERFGRIVDVFKKPGHHIGPAKNPDCTCEHCKRHFETVGRNRTRSWGDSSNTTTTPTNWKEALRGSARRDVVKEANEPVHNSTDADCKDF